MQWQKIVKVGPTDEFQHHYFVLFYYQTRYHMYPLGSVSKNLPDAGTFSPESFAHNRHCLNMTIFDVSKSLEEFINDMSMDIEYHWYNSANQIWGFGSYKADCLQFSVDRTPFYSSGVYVDMNNSAVPIRFMMKRIGQLCRGLNFQEIQQVTFSPELVGSGSGMTPAIESMMNPILQNQMIDQLENGSWSQDRFPRTNVNYSLVNMRGLPFYIPSGTELLEDWTEKMWNEFPDTEFLCVMVGYRPILQSLVQRLPVGVGVATLEIIGFNVAFERGNDIVWPTLEDIGQLDSELLQSGVNNPPLGRWNYLKMFQEDFSNVFALEKSLDAKTVLSFLRGWIKNPIKGARYDRGRYFDQ